MIEVVESTVNLAILTEELKVLQYKKDDTNVYMAFGQGQPIPEKLPTCMTIAVKEAEYIAQLKASHIMVNVIKPGTMVPRHQDFIHGNIPWMRRYHLPVQTNPNAIWWDEDGGLRWMMRGMWYGPVPYWRMHTVKNEGTSDRIHLIVDLKGGTPMGDYQSPRGMWWQP